MIWSVGFTVLGYLWGKAVESILGDVKTFEHLALAAAGFAAAVFAVYQAAGVDSGYCFGRPGPGIGRR